MLILKITTYTVGLLFAVSMILALYIAAKFLYFFENRKCKYCNHRMEYKGLKENPTESHYLFHCPKCGAWEELPADEQHGKTCNS